DQRPVDPEMNGRLQPGPLLLSRSHELLAALAEGDEGFIAVGFDVVEAHEEPPRAASLQKYSSAVVQGLEASLPRPQIEVCPMVPLRSFIACLRSRSVPPPSRKR